MSAEVTEADAVTNVRDILGATVIGKATDAANAAYIKGICIDCQTSPHSAGRPRCDACHRARLTAIGGHTVADLHRHRVPLDLDAVRAQLALDLDAMRAELARTRPGRHS